MTWLLLSATTYRRRGGLSQSNAANAEFLPVKEQELNCGHGPRSYAKMCTKDFSPAGRSVKLSIHFLCLSSKANCARSGFYLYKPRWGGLFNKTRGAHSANRQSLSIYGFFRFVATSLHLLAPRSLKPAPTDACAAAAAAASRENCLERARGTYHKAA